MIWRHGHRRFAAASLLAFAAVLLIPAVAAAQVTRRCTNTIRLDGTGNLGKKSPAPRFKLNDVTVKKCLSVNKRTGEVEQTCRFENRGRTPVKFLFCNMVETRSSTRPVRHDQRCSIGFDAVARKWKCFPDPIPAGFNHPPSFHFGCTVVELAARGAAGGRNRQEFMQKGLSDDFRGKEAKDFQVAYADIFDLSIADQANDCGFNDPSCAGCFGKNMGTNFEGGTGAVPGRATATGFWIMSDVPITDPYVRWQELDGTLHPIEYHPIDSELSVPSGFPVDCPLLGRTSPDVEPPLSYTQDLLLWDIFTMSDPPTSSTPVVVETFADGEPFGVEITASPSFVEVAGGSMEYGTITISQPRLGLVPEGAAVQWSIAFRDPEDPELQLWEQDGRAIQDSVPPVVESHSEVFDASGGLRVAITARDATTSVVAANLFYTLDGGRTWLVEPLTPMVDPIDDPAVNTFEGTVLLDVVGTTRIEFFYHVQDLVLNSVWFGPGTADLKDCNRNGVDDSIDIVTGTSQDINGNEIPDECELGRTVWVFRGTAAGGEITTTIEGFFQTCTVTVATTPGESAETVALNLAAALQADACLAFQGITVSSSDRSVILSGFLIDPDRVTTMVTDSGLEHQIPIFVIPTLTEWGFLVLIMLLLAVGWGFLARQ